jgi:hypothetical protein
VEDFIGEVVVHVVKNSPRYNPGIAKDSTWVWHVAENKCKAILSHYQKMKYVNCETVALSSEMESYIASPKANLERREAMNVVERVIEYASDAALELLESILTGRAPKNPDPTAVEDLKEAAQRCSARLRDFEIAYRFAVR